MKKLQLNQLLFLALCCDIGMFAKRIISPVANIITGSLHIPGGISTGFSLMFLVVAAELVPNIRCATIMAVVQSVIALSLGRVGSMGALMLIGYIIPGAAIDLVIFVTMKTSLDRTGRMCIANMAASISAACTANLMVFHLSGIVLALYICVAGTTGFICGILGSEAVSRLQKVAMTSRQRG